ncbi:hypothetical protein ASA1KI_24520 [Opitutales bacterium ASA1]|uniref:3-keto-disaccharide hydrolase n=1 Tax=Congregicoccus parvus TaxID=3081749 RepID=UPI002B2BE2C3|nr:hypothetical protein ASA1KI_24520 [Opitutales bacterium ASA1]
MMRFIPLVSAFVLISTAAHGTDSRWTDLLAENSTDSWRSVRSENFPSHGWTLADGVLTVHKSGGEESRGGGDIVTRARYSSFELEVEFRMTPGCNSGIKFFVQPNLSPIDRLTGRPTNLGSAIGPEFQILDDARHPDAKAGRDGNRTVASLYDLIPAAAGKVVKPMGEWNQARIVVRGSQVEFHLNGKKTLAYDRHSAAYRELVAQSKYNIIPEFGEWTDGHILLQDHGDEVSFRNVRIRELTAD